MGPTNIALVKLLRAEQKLREGQSRLEAVSKNVRIQERKVNELSERHSLSQATLKEQQGQVGEFDLEVKTRDAKIERLRTQQQNAKNNREYQAFLVEINSEKLDKAKVEEQLLSVMASVEKLQAETRELSGLLNVEKEKAQAMRGEIGGRVKQLQAEIDSLRVIREGAAGSVPQKALEAFERLADRFEGEAMSALAKPDRRREEYACTACNMDLVTDVYNKLHSRDELIFCPSCKRILYIPDDLPIELAVNKVKEKKEPRIKTSNLKAAVNRQTAAEDVMKSITLEEDDSPTEGTTSS
ncbi:MAG: C4-type zinc ribbon domain-containing protein [Tepidisphaeraceae bacterium]|jgi:predicted  nucleic acid-binding Zn-ribbon protein